MMTSSVGFTIRDRVQAYWLLRQFWNRSKKDPKWSLNLYRSEIAHKKLVNVIKEMWVTEREQEGDLCQSTNDAA